MNLLSATVGPFKSISSPQSVTIEESVTVFVGMNEAGKTVFLQALEKSNDALGFAEFDPVDDYPRKDLSAYLRQHDENPAKATILQYRLSDKEVESLNVACGTKIANGFEFSVTRLYENTSQLSFTVSEQPAIEAILKKPELSSDAKAKLKGVTSIRAIPEALKGANLTEPDKVFVTALEQRIAKSKWPSVVRWEVWQWLSPRVPKFLYFSDYDLLPSKMNLADLASRVTQAKTDPKQLHSKHRAVLALLRMADIAVDDFTRTGGYEALKAKIEGVSISLTDQIMEFWKQNEDLEVEVDIKADSEDEAPFNNGVNLYLRIKNRRHRGVSTPFAQRSRGFIWFFSFLVWFDRVQQQIDDTAKTSEQKLILLLDEPGLALHALAQADFLLYIDELAKRHQVLYTTHSPFMVHSDRLNQVRVVEDQNQVGTVISTDLGGSNPRTIFPLQAALGWTLAQNLFISERNLLVEGPADLIYLRRISALLEEQGRPSLSDDVTVVPVGGLDKLVTFIALLGASGLKLVVFHDYAGAPEQKLEDLVRQKLVSPKALMNASQFRDLNSIGTAKKPADTEDLFSEEFYVSLFNETFAKQLGKKKLKPEDLPPGDRIIERIARWMKTKDIQLRPSGGFNHYLVASHFASMAVTNFDSDTLERFSKVFQAVNSLLSAET